jgi:hypothetical protein
MATKTKARRRPCPKTADGLEQEWQQVTDSETKDPTAGKGGKEKKPIGGKPKWKCVPIKEKATEE